MKRVRGTTGAAAALALVLVLTAVLPAAAATSYSFRNDLDDYARRTYFYDLMERYWGTSPTVPEPPAPEPPAPEPPEGDVPDWSIPSRDRDEILQRWLDRIREPETPPAPEPPPPDAGDPEEPAGLSDEERYLFRMINQERTARGLNPLEIDMTLVKLARLKCTDMIENHYFSHYSPTYGTVKDMLASEGITDYRWAGECIAGTASVERAHQAFMESDDHRAHIVSSIYTHVGVGVVHGGPYGLMVTEIFVAR